MQYDDPTVAKAIWKKVRANTREGWPNVKRDSIDDQIDQHMLEAGVPRFGSVKATGFFILAIIPVTIFSVIAL